VECKLLSGSIVSLFKTKQGALIIEIFIVRLIDEKH